jgi:hypothetical protein
MLVYGKSNCYEYPRVLGQIRSRNSGKKDVDKYQAYGKQKDGSTSKVIATANTPSLKTSTRPLSVPFSLDVSSSKVVKQKFSLRHSPVFDMKLYKKAAAS